jgi:predicted transcriptional regulator
MPKKNFTLSLDRELVEKMRKQAKAEKRSLSNMIEIAILKYLEGKEK